MQAFKMDSSRNWDFNPSDGITVGSFDFVGVATHELGHVMGFTSGVDLFISAFQTPPVNDNFLIFRTLDLFRFSNQSGLGTPDVAIDTREKFFPLLGGGSVPFSTGLGDQASHWKDQNPPIGIMDPSAVGSTVFSISSNDIEALDSIGWTLAIQSGGQVPEPSTLLLLASGLTVLSVWSWRSSRQHTR